MPGPRQPRPKLNEASWYKRWNQSMVDGDFSAKTSLLNERKSFIRQGMGSGGAKRRIDKKFNPQWNTGYRKAFKEQLALEIEEANTKWQAEHDAKTKERAEEHAAMLAKRKVDQEEANKQAILDMEQRGLDNVLETRAGFADYEDRQKTTGKLSRLGFDRVAKEQGSSGSIDDISKLGEKAYKEIDAVKKEVENNTQTKKRKSIFQDKRIKALAKKEGE